MKNGSPRHDANPFAGIVLFFVSFMPVASFVAPSRADEARKLVDKAIRAHGGEQRIARTKTGRIQAKADGMIAGTFPFRISWEELFDLPRRYRQSIEGSKSGMPVQWSFAIVGREGWARQELGVPEALHPEPPLPVEGHWHTILPHLLLLRNKEFHLSFLGEAVQDIRTLAGIRAESRRTVADFYFDKFTGLLVRARRAMPHFMPGAEVIGDIFYEDYREVDGVHFPMRFQANSGQNLSIKLQITSLKWLDKIDERAFAKPVVAEPHRPSSAKAKTPSGAEAERTESAPARWDIRLAVAILCMGAVSAAVWLILRVRKGKESRMPQP